MIGELNSFLTGWVAFFRHAECKSHLQRLDEWIRVTGPVGGREVAGLNFAVPGRLVELFSISAGQLAAFHEAFGLLAGLTAAASLAAWQMGSRRVDRRAEAG